jgi:hypothetical protein
MLISVGKEDDDDVVSIIASRPVDDIFKKAFMNRIVSSINSDSNSQYTEFHAVSIPDINISQYMERFGFFFCIDFCKIVSTYSVFKRGIYFCINLFR